ncbi:MULTISPECIES: hypothetical protein [Peribacillus]|uniref:hypothetical protein n=2 Tax=Bacillaceae TaxID=186817 RepID=UPI001F4D6217|nr:MULTISPECIES: hypothetical protein [unclassified Peribacillus]MCK1983715.1 hypothetical protein [Peribacillus sp. Aquil_B1]MCK2009865.1 hypothetical protein [Peribacillus sp. Aquil_B8]
MQGYIKLYREILQSPIWQDPPKLRLWLLCLMKANHQQAELLIENQIINLSPGQFLTGRLSLEVDYNRNVPKKYIVSGKTLWRWLKLLESKGSVSIKSTNKYSIVTIVNWDKYQKGDQELSSKSSVTYQHDALMSLTYFIFR